MVFMHPTFPAVSPPSSLPITMRAVILVLAALCLVALSTAIHTEYAKNSAFIWNHYKIRFAKQYASTEEENKRYAIFQANMKTVDEMNAQVPDDGISATYGPTQFADLTTEEFKAQYLTLRLHPDAPTAEEHNVVPLFEPRDIPTSYNWNDEGALTPVYNQGQCGSCWTFSVTEQIESMHWLKHKNDPNPPAHPTQLSMQQIVDCDTGDGDQGCNGGDPRIAYAYVQRVGGLDTFASYPYKAVDGTCKFQASGVQADVNGWSYVTPNTTKNETQMLYYVATTGPVSVCVDAASWQLYFGGVVRTFCGQNLDHAVQLVGYGSESGALGTTNYWVVRNSWGASWGEQGFIRVERDKNLCGIADLATTVSISD